MFILNHKFRDPFFMSNNQSSKRDYKIEHTETNSVLTLQVPGFKKEDFSIEIEDEQLNIRTENRETTSLKEAKSLQKEFCIKAINKRFKISSKHYDFDNINVNYEAGILQIELPKNAPTKQRITVN